MVALLRRLADRVIQCQRYADYQIITQNIYEEVLCDMVQIGINITKIKLNQVKTIVVPL